MSQAYWNGSHSGGKQFKELEKEFQSSLSLNKITVVRVDGHLFSKLTKNTCVKPYDKHFAESMRVASESVMKETGAMFFITHSDETSFVFAPVKSKHSLYNLRVNKIITLISGLMSTVFTLKFNELKPESIGWLKLHPSYFDARVFQLKHTGSIVEYMKWRQEDCKRNGHHGVAKKHFSQKQLTGLNAQGLNELVCDKMGIEYGWESYPKDYKYGFLQYYTRSRVVSLTYKTIEGDMREFVGDVLRRRMKTITIDFSSMKSFNFLFELF